MLGGEFKDQTTLTFMNLFFDCEKQIRNLTFLFYLVVLCLVSNKSQGSLLSIF